MKHHGMNFTGIILKQRGGMQNIAVEEKSLPGPEQTGRRAHLHNGASIGNQSQLQFIVPMPGNFIPGHQIQITCHGKLMRPMLAQFLPLHIRLYTARQYHTFVLLLKHSHEYLPVLSSSFNNSFLEI